MQTATGEYKGVPIHPKIKEVLEQFEYEGGTIMTYWPAPKAFWKRLRSTNGQLGNEREKWGY
jgi:hypothetical protein